jgi:ABC-type antimicrobial peptide transport system permease subunit
VERGASVAIVSEAAARRLWPEESPLGKRLRTRGEDGPEYEVVGVAGDAKVRSLGEDPQPFLYVPIRNYGGMMHLIARAPSDPAAVVAALRRQIAEIDDDMAVFQAATMTEHLSLMLFPFRMAAAVSAALGLLGLTLAGVGLYGVVSYGVAQRTREMGLRMALGANARDVVRLVVGEGMRVVVVGVIVGLALAFLATRVLSSALFGINPSDPITFVVTPTLLAVVALAASILPARRATKVDPVRALRSG